MKKSLLLIALCLLAAGAGAQEKKRVITHKVTTHYTAQPSMMYAGVFGGLYHYEYYDGYYDHHDHDYVDLNIQFDYLYSLVGDINKSVSPYVGGETTLGITRTHPTVSAGACVGVMLGEPSFRFDARLQPMLLGIINYDVRISLCLALRAGVWINRFNFYGQYYVALSSPTPHGHGGNEGSGYGLGIGLGWRF